MQSISSLDIVSEFHYWNNWNLRRIFLKKSIIFPTILGLEQTTPGSYCTSGSFASSGERLSVVNSVVRPYARNNSTWVD